jgi:hypothetical protein
MHINSVIFTSVLGFNCSTVCTHIMVLEKYSCSMYVIVSYRQRLQLLHYLVDNEILITKKLCGKYPVNIIFFFICVIRMLLLESREELTDRHTHSSRQKSTGFIVLINMMEQSPSEAKSHWLVNKFPIFRGTWRFIRAHHRFLSWTTRIQSTSLFSVSFRFILLLSCNQCLGIFFSQAYWGFGLYPSSSILKDNAKGQNVSETGSFSVLRWGVGYTQSPEAFPLYLDDCYPWNQ